MLLTEKKFSLEKVYPVGFYQIDLVKSLKPSMLFNFLQEIAAEDAENNAFGFTNISAKNMGWFVTRYHLEFDNYPSDVADITIKTVSRGYKKFFAYRDFELYSDNKLLGKVISEWILVDTQTRKIADLREVLPDVTPYESREDDLKFNKILHINKISDEKNFSVLYENIDVNGHANNSTYLTWALETLDVNFRKGHKLKTVDISFKKETSFSDKIVSQVELDKNTLSSRHCIKNVNTEEALCLLQMQFMKLN